MLVRRLTAAALSVVLGAGLLGAPLIGAPLLGFGAAAASVEGSVAAHSSVLSAETKPRPRQQLRRQGRWMVDPQGRVVLVHGVNLVYKHAPYVPPATRGGFLERDARWLRRHGFNAARIGTLWAGLTPDAPGVADHGYIAAWQRIIDLLAENRIWMQFDFHQDMWHETYGGEGAPDWAMIRPAPYSLLPYLPVPFPMGYWTPEVSTVYDEFFANKHGLLDGWVAAWEVAARTWRNQPYSMGYDLINEPWAGMEGMTCLVTGCPETYRKELQPAYEKALKAIRAIDPGNIVWWEPQQFAGATPVDTYFEAVAGEENLGFSWHSYCPLTFVNSMLLPLIDTSNCASFAAGRQEHALDQARRMRAVPMMSEWGATDDVTSLAVDARAADDHLMGWMHWAYKHWNDPTTADAAQGLFHDDASFATVKQDKLRVLVRTYPQRTAGIPLSTRFNPDNGDFHFRYRPKRSIKAPTQIFVSPLHYPNGWRARVDNGRIVKQTKRRLVVRATGTDPVTVRIVRR
ncbi:cellulase family glycosylhydrolase [Nocardioides limicola]|uniref:cellulase family glycosylhydrolase n=1 Tax=Nocardioides limicola TaxID=2803368 RepID=UPI00193B113D|nr:cellulase family glycosylhydrolase [Nocardioides sp. DJM-14]